MKRKRCVRIVAIGLPMPQPTSKGDRRDMYVGKKMLLMKCYIYKQYLIQKYPNDFANKTVFPSAKPTNAIYILFNKNLQRKQIKLL